MKILNVMLTTGKGGLEQVFLDYNYAFKLKGIESISIIHNKSGITLDEGDNFYKVANFSKYDPFALFKLWQILAKEKPDLILTHGNRAHYLMRKIASSRVVVGVSHVYSFKYITKCDYIISVNKDMMGILEDTGYNKSRLFHIPNMLKTQESIKYSKPALSKRPTIGLMARLDPIKGADIFVKAISILKSRNININAMIGGEGMEYQNTKKLISDLSLEENITMLGWIENKEDFYSKIDILCMPSTKETFGLVILEAFLYSKPVIISDLPGPMEIVENEENGLVFETNNAQDLANKIEMLIQNEGLMSKLSKQGFKDLGGYSEKEIADKIASSFGEILKQEGEKLP